MGPSTKRWSKWLLQDCILSADVQEENGLSIKPARGLRRGRGNNKLFLGNSIVIVSPSYKDIEQ